MNAPAAELTDVKVSVCMITYNHEDYIAQAIDSVLMQEVDFEYELVIGEDHSTDGTREIVADYARSYPHRIRLLLHERNLGMMSNFVATLKACRGRYVALLEGDDYWTDPLKLQKQVGFLEAHPDCVVCFHTARVVDQDGISLGRVKPQNVAKTIIDLNYLLGETNFAPTCSVMFRSGLVAQYPEWFYALPVGDWAFLVLNAQFGKIGYVREVMSVYRSHPGGVFSRQAQIEKYHLLLAARQMVASHLGAQHRRRITLGIARIYLGLSAAYADVGDIPMAKRCFAKSIKMHPLSLFDRTFDVLAMLGRLFVPRAYMLLRPIRADRSMVFPPESGHKKKTQYNATGEEDHDGEETEDIHAGVQAGGSSPGREHGQADLPSGTGSGAECRHNSSLEAAGSGRW